MKRRSFIGTLGMATGIVLTDPEELLWRPTKTFFIPKEWNFYKIGIDYGNGPSLTAMYFLDRDGLWCVSETGTTLVTNPVLYQEPPFKPA